VTLEQGFSEEQEDLRSSLRRVLADKASAPTMRAVTQGQAGYDLALWTQLVSLGMSGLCVPERYGGSGGGIPEIVVAAEEMGRALAPAPWFSSVLAAQAILAMEDPAAAQRLLPGLCEGKRIATVAVVTGPGGWSRHDPSAHAYRDGPHYRVCGTKTFVTDGDAADLVLCVVTAPSGPSLFVVDSRAEGVQQRPLDTVDLTRRFTEIAFDDAVGDLVGTEGAGQRALDQVCWLAPLILAGEAVGGAQRCLDNAVAHAKRRVQFGRLIGSFQAVKHMCAELLLDVESARSTLYRAMWATHEGEASAKMLTHLAKAYCCDTYMAAAVDNIQIHGGIGFTWEHEAHLHYRRAHVTRQLFDDPTFHRDRLVDCLLEDANGKQSA
jgi:alkylation response protein AidB-like acyl-CoA dehydrogenase